MAKEDTASRVSALLEPYLAQKSLDIYKIEYKKEGKDWILRVYLDKPADSDSEFVSIEECEDVSRHLSEELDKEDIIGRSYNLEVCSPGLDRELISDADYSRFAGRLVEVKTYQQIEGSKEHEGTLIGKENGCVLIEKEEGRLAIEEDKISKINLAVVF